MFRPKGSLIPLVWATSGVCCKYPTRVTLLAGRLTLHPTHPRSSPKPPFPGLAGSLEEALYFYHHRRIKCGHER